MKEPDYTLKEIKKLEEAIGIVEDHYLFTNSHYQDVVLPYLKKLYTQHEILED